MGHPPRGGTCSESKGAYTRMSTVEALSVSPEEWLKLDEELKQLMKDQAAGLLERQPNETEDVWKDRTAKRMKRGVEITSILRRTNTGPAAPKRKGRSSKNVDMEGLAKNLLG